MLDPNRPIREAHVTKNSIMDNMSPRVVHAPWEFQGKLINASS
jgi:hypothetical protein